MEVVQNSLAVPVPTACAQLGGVSRTTLYELVKQRELVKVNIGQAARACLDCIHIAVRNRRLNGLPNSSVYTALADALHKAVSAQGHSDVPETVVAHSDLMPTVPVDQAAPRLGLSPGRPVASPTARRLAVSAAGACSTNKQSVNTWKASSDGPNSTRPRSRIHDRPRIRRSHRRSPRRQHPGCQKLDPAGTHTPHHRKRLGNPSHAPTLYDRPVHRPRR